MSELTCARAMALSTARLAGLSDADRVRLEAHIAGCARCGIDARALESIVELAKSASVEPGVSRRALARAFAGERPVTRPRAGAGRGALSVAAFGIAAAALLAVWVSGAGRVASDGEHRAEAPAVPERVVGYVVASSPTRLTIAHASVDLEPGTELSWSGAVVAFRQGRALFSVDPSVRRPFSVETARFTVHVTGTVFSMTENSVDVREGTVEVRTPWGTLLATLHEGDAWELAEPPALEASADAEPGAGEAVAAPDAPLAAERGRAAASLASASSPSERFAVAASLEASDPDAAATLYRGLERDGGAWAQNALFARASLALSRGQRVEARRLLGRYVAEHPDGPNAADARNLLRGL